MENLGTWQEQVRSALTTPQDLLEAGLLSPDQVAAYQQVLDRYSLFVPRYYLGLMERTNPLCPIRMQAIPDPQELQNRPTFGPDPLGDLRHRPASRITHRYGNRVLLHLTSNCPMYCRYCFRKELLNADAHKLFEGQLGAAFEYLRQHNEVEEVILSGGDPLMVPDRTLADVLQVLGTVAHIRRVRIHSRAPVTLPARVDEGLIRVLGDSPRPVVFVTHFNHPREMTPQARRACQDLKGVCALVLNQSVLLRHVNDSVAVLQELSLKLFEAGVLPYYLHQLDRTTGTGHFETPEVEGQKLFEDLRAALPGYLVPRYVRDGGDRRSKTWLV